jgi:hypothetical protein
MTLDKSNNAALDVSAETRERVGVLVDGRQRWAFCCRAQPVEIEVRRS